MVYQPFWHLSESLLLHSSNHHIIKSSITEMEYIEIKETARHKALKRGF